MTAGDMVIILFDVKLNGPLAELAGPEKDAPEAIVKLPVTLLRAVLAGSVAVTK